MVEGKTNRYDWVELVWRFYAQSQSAAGGLCARSTEGTEDYAEGCGHSIR